MAPAVPPAHPARPRTGSVRASHGVKKERQKRVAALRLLGAEHGSALQGIHRPERIHSPDNLIHAWRGSTGRYPWRSHPRATQPPGHGVKKERQKRVAALRLLGAEHGSALQGTHRPERIHSPDNLIHAWRGSTGRYPWRSHPRATQPPGHGVKKERQKRVGALRLLGVEHGSALQKIHSPDGLHPRMAWIHRTRRESVEGGEG